MRVSGDLRHARALFTVHGLDEAALERVRDGLDHASGYFRHAIGGGCARRSSPAVTFAVDRVFDKAMRVESLLREIGQSAPRRDEAEHAPATPDADDDDADDDDDEPDVHEE